MPRGSKCRKVVVAYDVQIPAMSESDVEVYAILPDLRQTTKSWATHPRVLDSGLVVAGTVLPNETQGMMMRVLNPTRQKLRLNRGNQWPVEEVDIVEAPLQTEHPHRTAAVRSSESGSDTLDEETLLEPLWTNVAEDVPEAIVSQLRAIIMENRQAFSLHEWDLGFTDVIRHEIDTGNEAPVRQSLRRQPLTQLPIIDTQVEQMLQQNVIEPSKSEWSSNVVLVRKKDGSTRFCVDYRAVNLKTRKDAYPLPLISECLDTLGSAKWFSTFDLRAGYHQMAVHPRDKHKTAFVTRQGSFQFRVLPFGLCNSPASFARMMNLVMAGLNFSICLIYLDDIIIFAGDLQSHLERLVQVLTRLRTANLKLKPSKCHLLQRKVLFLGHVVSAEGVATDPAKVATVKEWPTPRNLRELRSFVGLCAYYRRFVLDFANIAKPLHAMTRKGQKFQWTTDCETAFVELKKRLTEAPVLALPQDEGMYILDTDASADSLGAVLSQVQDGLEKVICYGSRVCSRSECNYDVTKRELLAIVYFLKTFRQYLLGRKFLLRTDHSALQWLRRTPRPVGQQARWLTTIEEFDFEVKHRGGTSHVNADAMSRRPLPGGVIRAVTTSSASSLSLPDDWDSSTLIREQRSDPELGWIVTRLLASDVCPKYDELRPLSGFVKTLVAQWPQLTLRDDLLCRAWLNKDTAQIERYQLIPPPARRATLVALSHEGMTGGHLGMRRTLSQLQRRAYWPGWKNEVNLHLKSCPNCARYRREKPPRQGLLQFMAVGEPMECLGIDITGAHPTSSNGYRYILTVIDHFTRWAEAFPIRNQEAITVATVLVDQVFSRYGCPKQILTDQGPCFEAHLFQELCQRLQIDKIRTSPYKPSTNGMIERFHRTLNSMLGKIVSDRQKDWDRCLPSVMAAYRATCHVGTGYSPNLLFLGREVISPIDLVLGDCVTNDTSSLTHDAFVTETFARLQTMYGKVREYTDLSAQTRAARYNLRVKPATFTKGQLVWYFCPRRRVGRKDKWSKFYSGPFEIIEQLGPVLYRIQLSPRSQPKVVYVDKLKPYLESPSRQPPARDPLGNDVPDLLLDECTLDMENSPGGLARPQRHRVRPARYLE